jgi:hypothetical protein
MAGTSLIPFVVIGLTIYALRKLLLNHRQAPLPPGPKRFPLVGNLTDLPKPGTSEYRHWLHLKDTYGPLLSLTVFGQTLVVIHDKDAALQLLDKQVSIYSGRPRMKFVEM